MFWFAHAISSFDNNPSSEHEVKLKPTFGRNFQ
jgi:hypothetical protein